MNKPNTAEEAYAAAAIEAMLLASKLQDRIMNLPAPNEHTHWGNVGDAMKLVHDLKVLLGEEE